MIYKKNCLNKCPFFVNNKYAKMVLFRILASV